MRVPWSTSGRSPASSSSPTSASRSRCLATTDFEDFTDFRPAQQHEDALDTLFDQLESWAEALQTVRD